MTSPGGEAATVRAVLRVDTSAARADIRRDMGRAGAESGREFSSRFKGGLGNLSRELLPAAGITAVVGGFGKAIGAAASLNAAVGANRQIFGATSKDMERWANTSASSIGLSKSAALDATKSFGSFFTAVGFSQQAAGKMSIEWTKMASNMAAFADSSPADTLDAIQGALRGELDPLQKYIPTVSAASLQQKAMAMSGKANADALTNQDKALAINALLMESNANKAGAAELAQGGFTQSLNESKAKLEDLAASVGQTVLPGLTGMLNAVNSIGPATIAMGAAGILLGRQMTGAGGQVRVAFGQIRAATQLGFGPLQSGATRSSQLLGTVRAAAVGVGGSLKGIGSAALGAFGGPAGLAITAAAVGIGMFMSNSAKAKAEVEALKGSLGSYADTFKDGITPATLDAAKATLSQNDELRGLVQTTQGLGITTKTLVDGLNGEAGARQQVVNAIQGQIDAELDRRAKEGAAPGSKELKQSVDLVAQLTRQRDAYGQTSVAATEAQQLTVAALNQTSAATTNLSTSEALAAANAKQAAAAQDYLKFSTDASSAAQTGLKASLDVLGGSTSQSQIRADALKTAMDNLYGATIRNVDANQTYEASWDTLSTSVGNNGRTLDVHTEKGRTNRTALEGLLTANGELYLSNIAAGDSTAAATRKHEKRTEAIRKEAQKLGLNKTETQKLIDTYGKIPEDETTKLILQGADQVADSMLDLALVQLHLSKGTPLGADLSRRLARHQYGMPDTKRATGGPLPGYAPHDRADNVVYAGTPGEWVIQRPTVRKVERTFGAGAMEHFNKHGQLPIQGRAKGGPVVTLPFKTNVSKTHIISFDEAVDVVMSKLEGAGGGGPGGGTQASLVAFGHWLQKKGFRVSEHPRFGGVSPVHAPGSMHYSGKAIDINKGSGTSSREQAYLRDILDDAHQGAGLRTIFMYPGHYNHLHADLGSGNLGQATGDKNGNQYNPAGAGGGGTSGAAQAYAKSRLGAYGWGGGQWGALKSLWQGESGWRWNATGSPTNMGRAYGIPQCVDLRTTILTRRGWLGHSEVRVGDETVGYNPATGKSEWTRITEVLHPGVAEVIQFGISRWKARSTANHRWLMQRMVEDKPVGEEMVELQHNLGRRHALITAKPMQSDSALDITAEEAALLAWIAGYGWQVKADASRRRRGMAYHIGQTTIRHWPEINRLVGDNGKIARIRSREVNGETHYDCEWRLTTPYSRDLTERAGNPKMDAVQQVLAMSDAQRAAWLAAMFNAEGWAGRSCAQYSQGEGPIAEAIKLAIYLQGKSPSVYKDTRNEDRAILTISPTEPVIGLRLATFTSVGVEEVWCVTTVLGTWTACQEDSIFLTGNSLPGSKMSANGSDWKTNPNTQINWGMGYIKSVYGNPNNAYSRWQGRHPHWYDDGGWLKHGDMGVNTSGKPEAVLTAEESRGLKAGLGGGVQYKEINVSFGDIHSDVDFAMAVDRVDRLGAGF